MTATNGLHIVIPDEYQDAVERLACYSLLEGHDVTRYREPAGSFEALVERLRPADVIVAIRERVNFNRAMIERLPPRAPNMACWFLAARATHQRLRPS
jgi:D-3-phosphoglycerate dehydrogenase